MESKKKTYTEREMQITSGACWLDEEGESEAL